MRIISTATLEYKGKKYVIKEGYDPSDVSSEGIARLWESGLGDLGKSEFIRLQCDPDFPEMDIGNKIKLTKLELKRVNKVVYDYCDGIYHIRE